MIITIEGTDCSGKETQSKMLYEKLIKNYDVYRTSFPNYESPTGKIVGGSYLGKKEIGECLFPEGAVNVNPKIASLLYAMDRLYNVEQIKENKNNIVILDRYVESNMAHQGCKINDKEERFKLYDWLEKLEYDLLELPKPNLKFFLYLPHEFAKELKKNRASLDQHELSEEYLKHAENTYLELAEKYDFITINCIKDNKIRTIDDINVEMYNIVNEYINNVSKVK